MRIRNWHRACYVIIISMLLCTLAPRESTAAPAKVQEPALRVEIDGKHVALSLQPILYQGGVMLPVNELFGKLDIRYTIDKKTITAYRNGIQVLAVIDQKKLTVGDRVVQLSQPPMIRNNRIYVPARLVSIVMDKPIEYDKTQRLVVIGLSVQAKHALQQSLFAAARKGDEAAIATLLKRGADPNGVLLKEYGEGTPLEYAVNFNHAEAVRVLLEGGAVVDPAQVHLADRAIVHQNGDMLNLLLQAGIDPNNRSNGSTLLEQASGVIGIAANGEFVKDLQPSPAIVTILLEHGADPGLDDSLSNAVQAQHYTVIQLLLRAGADPYKPDWSGTTPYDRSTIQGIHRWMTIQEERLDIPAFAVEDHEGNPVKEGGLFLRSANGQSIESLNWNNGIVYADIPDGSYELDNAWHHGYAAFSPQGVSIQIEKGIVTPGVIRMPAPNITATVQYTGDSAKRMNGGYVGIYNITAGSYQMIHVSGDSFCLYAGPGQYRVVYYRDVDNNYYEFDQMLTVSSDTNQWIVKVPVNAIQASVPN
jgi:ankyrin repeat protein